MHVLGFALLIGIIAGLRAFTAPTAVSWAAKLGYITLSGTKLAWLASPITVGIFTVLCVVELINDQNPKTPSRKVPQQFGARILTGGFSGAAIGLVFSSLIGGLIAGIVGAIIGTLGGAAVRGALAKAFGRDLPAGLLEDVVALAGAALIITHL